MSKRFFFILSLLMPMLVVQAQIQHFEWQNVQREYLVKIPADHDETIPVMYFLHGLNDNITRLDNEFHFQQIADDFGWMMVVPQALNEGYGTMWNVYLMYSTTDDSGSREDAAHPWHQRSGGGLRWQLAGFWLRQPRELLRKCW